MSEQYAVAVNLTKQGSGKTSIMTHMDVYVAASKDEARGKAFVAATADCPEHEVSNMLVMLIEPEKVS